MSRSRSPSRSSRSRSPRRRSPRVDSVALKACNGLLSDDCRSRAFCRWVKASEHKNKKGLVVNFKGHCKKARVSKKSPRSKSPKPRGRPRKNPMRSPSKCRPLGASDCKVRKGCAWVKAHNGRNGVAISSMCRGVRVSKKSPKRSPKPRGRPRKSPAVRRSRCNSKRRSECKESAASCRWVSGYVNSKTNKKVASMCRRRRRRVSAKSASPRKASPHFLRTVRSM